MKQFALVTVNFNSLELVKQLWISLQTQTLELFDLILVDNQSSPTEQVSLKEFCSTHSIFLIQSSVNLGFAHGSNQGIRHALKEGYDIVGLVNPDCVFYSPNFFENLQPSLLSSDIVSPLIKYWPDTSKIYSAGGDLRFPILFPFMRGQGKTDTSAFHNSSYCTFATGCALFATRRSLELIGPLPEVYFLYFEETEWCNTANRLGMRILFEPRAIVAHATSSTVSYLSATYLFYMVRNFRLFAHRNVATRWLPVFYMVYAFVWIPGYILKCIFQKQFKSISHIIFGAFSPLPKPLSPR
jgi:GT2 family glycosyltransferase